jgi:hypothetical protein
VSRPALGPTQPPVQWVPGVLSQGVKARPGRDADRSPPSSAEVVYELELYLLSPQAPPWRVEGLLYLITFISFFFTTDDDQHGGTNAFGLCPIKVCKSSWLLVVVTL